MSTCVFTYSLSFNILMSCEKHKSVFKKYLLKLVVTSKVGTVGICSNILPQNANCSTFIVF